MKKQDIYLIILFISFLSLSFLSLKTDKVIGQTDSTSSSSSSSSGEITGGELPSSSSGEVTILTEGSSSSSSGVVCVTDSDCPPGVCPNGQTYQAYTCQTDIGNCVQLQFIADPCQFLTSSSSGGTSSTLSNNFTGIWKARVPKERPQGSSSSSGEVVSTSSSSSGDISSSSSGEISTSSSGEVSVTRKAHLDVGYKGASIITFKLCVKDGMLEGIVHQGGTILTGAIKDPSIISENEVEFTVEGRNGRTGMIYLKLTGDRQFVGKFVDGHEFIGRKLNENRGCFAPGKDKPRPGLSGSGGPPTMVGMSGPSMFGGEEDIGPGMSGTSTTSGGLGMGMFGGDDVDEFMDSPSTSMGDSMFGGESHGPQGMDLPSPSMGNAMFGGEELMGNSMFGD